VQAILSADWVLIAPGSLYTSTLATCALPQIRLAIDRAPGRILWVCNLESEHGETASMTADDQLSALRAHGVRVDGVLYDPEAELHFSPTSLARNGVAAFAWSLQAGNGPTHDSRLLGAALESVLDAQASAVATSVGRGA
jgi:2-phospho-L-lactate transferase/gluconeogenesis factor (CofD/UPF0052 family)